jgi:putative transposase
MSRLARVVIPGLPHHIIQRGNRRQVVFFQITDKRLYLRILARRAFQAGISFLAYCLMDNHVHFVAIPSKECSLARGMGDTHKEYTRIINFREGWKGYLWQGPLDESYLYAAVKYIERNPVRARIVERAEDYPWSSARAHIFGHKDCLISDSSFAKNIGNWAEYLKEEVPSEIEIFKKHLKTGRPLGNKEFIRKIEQLTGRELQKKKPGPKLSDVSP